MTGQSMGEFLGILRKASGYTQQEVAEKLNVSNRTLSSWETDRTAPDILLLPAIADLYGVTVDELIRGERSETGSGAEISEKAIRSARKYRFGIFSFRCMLLNIFGCLSVALTSLSCFTNLCVASPLWLDITISVIGACGFIACATLLICFYTKAKHAEGIILAEDCTQDKAAYALALRQKSKSFFAVCAVPLLICAYVLFIIYFCTNPHDTATIFQYDNGLGYVYVSVKTYLKTRFRIAMALNTVLALALIAGYFVYGNAGLTAMLTDSQKAVRRRNLKLAAVICAFACIPLTASAVMLTIVLMYGTVNLVLLFTGVSLIAATVSVCIIIYAVKRKKQSCEF